MLSEAARKIAEEAKSKGMWIYDRSYKKWYSPEDFKHIFTYVNATEDYLKTLQIRHPSDGIEAGFMKMEDIQKRLQVFIKKVTEYYQS